MGSGPKFQELGGGIVRRREKKKLALFIDGTGLDRASRRVNRKVDMSALVRGVSSGTQPVLARYYTLIPYEDDSRQRAFLDAVTRSGLTVVVKRLPPKGVNRKVSIDIEMAADMVAFALGVEQFAELSDYAIPENPAVGAPRGQLPRLNPIARAAREPALAAAEKHRAMPESTTVTPVQSDKGEHRMITVVCPSRDLSYAIALVKSLGIDTTAADFGQFASGDMLKSAAKWIDLSDSETIWRE